MKSCRSGTHCLRGGTFNWEGKPTTVFLLRIDYRPEEDVLEYALAMFRKTRASLYSSLS